MRPAYPASEHASAPYRARTPRSGDHIAGVCRNSTARFDVLFPVYPALAETIG